MYVRGAPVRQGWRPFWFGTDDRGLREGWLPPSPPRVTMMRTSRLLFLWLAIAGAVILRAAMPTGWMPAHEDGKVRIVLCSGSGPVELASAELRDRLGLTAHQTERGGEDRGDASHDPCPYGLALAKAFDVPPAIPSTPTVDRIPSLHGPAYVTARLLALRSLRPPARGPPEAA